MSTIWILEQSVLFTSVHLKQTTVPDKEVLKTSWKFTKCAITSLAFRVEGSCKLVRSYRFISPNKLKWVSWVRHSLMHHKYWGESLNTTNYLLSTYSITHVPRGSLCLFTAGKTEWEDPPIGQQTQTPMLLPRMSGWSAAKLEPLRYICQHLFVKMFQGICLECQPLREKGSQSQKSQWLRHTENAVLKQYNGMWQFTAVTPYSESEITLCARLPKT